MLHKSLTKEGPHMAASLRNVRINSVALCDKATSVLTNVETLWGAAVVF
jgi:hypothetical protein